MGVSAGNVRVQKMQNQKVFRDLDDAREAIKSPRYGEEIFVSLDNFNYRYVKVNHGIGYEDWQRVIHAPDGSFILEHEREFPPTKRRGKYSDCFLPE